MRHPTAKLEILVPVDETFEYQCVLKPNLHPGGPSSTPTIPKGKVYTISKEGHIFCLNAKIVFRLFLDTCPFGIYELPFQTDF